MSLRPNTLKFFTILDKRGREVSISDDSIDLLLQKQLCFLDVDSFLSVPDQLEIVRVTLNCNSAEFFALPAFVLFWEENIYAEHTVGVTQYLDEQGIK
jgi:hypothetical protein